MRYRFPRNCGERLLKAIEEYLYLYSADGFQKRSTIRGLGFRDKESPPSLHAGTKVSAADSLWTWFRQTSLPHSLSLSAPSPEIAYSITATVKLVRGIPSSAALRSFLPVICKVVERGEGCFEGGRRGGGGERQGRRVNVSKSGDGEIKARRSESQRQRASPLPPTRKPPFKHITRYSLCCTTMSNCLSHFC